MKAICISGAVGTGKTTLAKRLAKKLGFLLLDFKMFVKEKKLSAGYDKKRKTDIIDEKRFVKEIVKEIKELKDDDVSGCIVESHMSHYIPKRYVDLCVVTKCELKELSKRLKKRRYSKSKIEENLECEIFDVCYEEAVDNGHNVIVIPTTKPLNMDKISRQVKNNM